MLARDIMSRDVRTCEKTDSLDQAARIMWEADVGSVVVVDWEQKPVGMITDRDIAMAAYTRGARLREVSVESAMAAEVRTCGADDSIAAIESLMQSAQLRRLPVVGDDGQLIGIVTLGDLARDAESSPLHVARIPGVAKTLASIIERRSAAAAE